MPVETIECQIVQGQLGRYLAGDSLSSEAVREMEGHIARCPICRVEVAQRRATLQTLLGIVPTPDTAEANPLLDLIRQRTPSTSTVPTHAVTPHLADSAGTTASDETPDVSQAPRRIFSKPLLLSGALAVVLLAMNAFVKSPTDLLGPRANQAAPAQSKTTLIAPAVATAPELSDRLFRAEWESFAFADLLEFDADLTDVMPAWRWLSLDAWSEEIPVADLIEEDASIAVESEADDEAIEAWEMLGVTEMLAEPVRSAPAPAPRRVSTPRRTAPRQAAPTPAEPTTPRSSIRVYPPES